MKFTITAVTVGLLISQVAASEILVDSNFIRSLHARQTIDPSEIPAGCESACAPVLNTVNGCDTNTPDLSCLCTADINTGLASCLSCAASVDKSDEETAQAQSTLQAFQQACAAAGSPVATLSLSSVAVTASPSAPPSGSISGSATTDGSVSQSASSSATPSGSSTPTPTAPSSASHPPSSSGSSSSASRTSSDSGAPSQTGNSAASIVNGMEGTIIAGLGSLFVLLGL